MFDNVNCDYYLHIFFAILLSYEPKKNIEQENQLLQIKSKSSVNSKSKDFGSEF